MSALDRILAHKRVEVRARKRSRPQAEVDAAAREGPKLRGFRDALRRAAENGYGLIAEIKKASPSKGLLRAAFDPPGLARAYERGGAACLSVLTDERFFQGGDADLRTARAACALPALRKDFLVDPWQVAESRALGADCVLVILAAVEDGLASELMAAAREWRMDALVEVHDRAELERAAALSAGLVGINNRNLATFETSLAVTERLAPALPPGTLVVSESGVSVPQDLDRLAACGVRCFLVGESLMRSPDVARATRALLARGRLAA